MWKFCGKVQFLLIMSYQSAIFGGERSWNENPWKGLTVGTLLGTFIYYRFKGIAKHFQGVIDLVPVATFITSWQVTKAYETLNCDKILSNSILPEKSCLHCLKILIMSWLFKDPINSDLAQFDHAQSNSKKWPNG